LTRRVPDLELDGAVFQDDGLREEGGADGGFLKRGRGGGGIRKGR